MSTLDIAIAVGAVVGAFALLLSPSSRAIYKDLLWPSRSDGQAILPDGKAETKRRDPYRSCAPPDIGSTERGATSVGSHSETPAQSNEWQSQPNDAGWSELKRHSYALPLDVEKVAHGPEFENS
jgi:hypothetical protein